VDVTPEQAMAGLHWLRREYAMDEAGAAREYAQRQLDELRAEEAEKLVGWGLLRREEEDDGLGPQSGESRYGRSVVQEAAERFQAERVRRKRVREEEAEVRNAEVLKNTEERRLSLGEQFVELGEYDVVESVR
jgi:hypothetical protein